MRAANIYRNLPVRHKLRLVIMVTVTLALLCACAAVLAYDRLAARDSMRTDLQVLAEMLRLLVACTALCRLPPLLRVRL